jgi:O-methyltransferase involved in polyketide biosynthesis
MKKFLMHLPQIVEMGSVSLSKVAGYPMHSIFISLLNTSWLSNIQGQLKSARQMMVTEGLRPIFPDTQLVPLLSGLTKRRYQMILACLENLDVAVSCKIDRLVWIRKAQESEKYQPLMEISFSGKCPDIRQGSLF